MNELAQTVGRQIAILFANTDETIGALEEPQLAEEGSWGWPIGEQVYHLLHSLDQWLINPYHYEEPPQQPQPSSKQALVDYSRMVQAKITDFLGTLDDQALSEYPKDCTFTRLELILGQHRHLMYHIGLIHGCLRSQTGHSPKFIGLSDPVTPVSKK
jgi:uncharacterized damage-inducible protein DinB